MFQSFDPPATSASPAETAARVAALRAGLAAGRVDGVIVPHADEYQGEYLPPSAERLAFLTGFTGSAGTALVLKDRAILFVDGRYTLQAARQVDPATFEIVDTGRTEPPAWMAENLPEGTRLGFDPRLFTRADVRRLEKALGGRVVLVPLAANPVDAVWQGRPNDVAAPVMLHPLAFAGREPDDKLAEVRTALGKARADAFLIGAADGVSWLFNIRGRDIAHTPIALARALVPAEGQPTLFVDPAKLSPEVRAALAEVADIAPPEALPDALAALGASGKRIAADPQSVAESLIAAAEAAGATIVEARDPTLLGKAVKNAAEIAGTRAAHARDGVALARFLAWFERTAPDALDEIAIAERLERFRRETNRLEEISFDTIAGAGEHGAIVHYRVTRDTSRALRAGELVLIDSGAQYRDGTTDVTRTLAVGTPSDEMRRQFTRVLKGHIAIAAARFPPGTTGAQLDSLARVALWRAGFDYAHGTGHGVGSFLSVHEGPQRISKLGHEPLKAGMIVSNEPGYYREGAFGIRIENLVLVTEPAVPPGGEAAMHAFETLTLAPIDRRLIVPTMLTPAETAWLDGYHARVLGGLSGLVDPETRTWLVEATRPIA